VPEPTARLEEGLNALRFSANHSAAFAGSSMAGDDLWDSRLVGAAPLIRVTEVVRYRRCDNRLQPTPAGAILGRRG
jgi:hypothetical protein